MFTIISGVGLLLLTLAGFSLFSMKAPKGSEAMSGMANAAIASFLIEAVHKYITGDLFNLEFFQTLGSTSGSLGGVAAAISVPLAMGANPVLAVVAGVAVGGYGILPGFIAGYAVGLIAPVLERKLPEGLNIIAGALMIAPLARIITILVDPAVNATLVKIGGTISAAADQSPLVMGFLLGGIMKMICTSPLSSMALTAMLGLNGLAMGIAAIACVGGSFTNGIIFHRMGFGDKSNVIAVMLEPLTQANIITKHPIPIYGSNFFGGGLSGIAGRCIRNHQQCTWYSISNPWTPCTICIQLSNECTRSTRICSSRRNLAGFVGSIVFKKLMSKETKQADAQAVGDVQFQ